VHLGISYNSELRNCLHLNVLSRLLAYKCALSADARTPALMVTEGRADHESITLPGVMGDSSADQPPPFSDQPTFNSVPSYASLTAEEFDAVGKSAIPSVSAKITHVSPARIVS